MYAREMDLLVWQRESVRARTDMRWAAPCAFAGTEPKKEPKNGSSKDMLPATQSTLNAGRKRAARSVLQAVSSILADCL